MQINCSDGYILCNVNQQNAHFLKINVLIQFFVSFYMFRTSYVHHQEDHLCKQFLWYVFHAEITIKGYIRYLSTKA